jgi:hypothetical protein
MVSASPSARRVPRRDALRGIGVAGAALVAAGLARDVAAQGAADAHPLVGVWRVTTDPAGSLFGLAAYHADGIMSFATSFPAPATPGSTYALVFEVPAYGVWEPTDGRSAALTGVHMHSDEQGNFIETLTFYAAVELDETGDAYDLHAVFEIKDPAGTVTFSGEATTHATRLRVQPAPTLSGTETPTA